MLSLLFAPLPRVPVMVMVPVPVEFTVAPPERIATPTLLSPVPAPPVPVMAMLPPAPVLVTREPAPMTSTPMFRLVPLPPMPVIATKPVDDSTTLPLAMLTPCRSSPAELLPWPRMEMLPAPERSCALSSCTPTTLVPVPKAAVVAGVAPPPRVMAPPALVMTVPEPRAIAPEPPPSRSALSVTA